MRNILLTALPGKTPTLQKPFPEMARAPLPNQALDLFGLVFVQVMMPVKKADPMRNWNLWKSKNQRIRLDLCL